MNRRLELAHSSNKLAVLVATKDRPAYLRRLLGSIAAQDYQPLEVVIVNGGEDSLEQVISRFPNLAINYLEVRPPGLTKQRNAGVQNTDPSATLIACLDDDVVLGEGAFAAMMSFWEEADGDVGGASFNLAIDRSQKWPGPLGNFKRDFGRVLPSGMSTPNVGAVETTQSQWLVGGATVWRREVFQDHRFNEGFAGSGRLEDVDFSYSVGKRYRLYVVADAKAEHLGPRGGGTVKGSFRDGKWWVVNRVAFVRRNRELSIARCFAALVVRSMIDLAKSVAIRDPLLAVQALGNVVGLGQVVTGRLPSDDAPST